MSKVQVDKVVNLSDDGAPQLTYGAALPVGYGLTGDGGINVGGNARSSLSKRLVSYDEYVRSTSAFFPWPPKSG